jgi:hypothetical protein
MATPRKATRYVREYYHKDTSPQMTSEKYLEIKNVCRNFQKVRELKTQHIQGMPPNEVTELLKSHSLEREPLSPLPAMERSEMWKELEEEIKEQGQEMEMDPISSELFDADFTLGESASSSTKADPYTENMMKEAAELSEIETSDSWQARYADALFRRMGCQEVETHQLDKGSSIPEDHYFLTEINRSIRYKQECFELYCLANWLGVDNHLEQRPRSEDGSYRYHLEQRPRSEDKTMEKPTGTVCVKCL